MWFPERKHIETCKYFPSIKNRLMGQGECMLNEIAVTPFVEHLARISNNWLNYKNRLFRAMCMRIISACAFPLCSASLSQLTKMLRPSTVSLYSMASSRYGLPPSAAFAFSRLKEARIAFTCSNRAPNTYRGEKTGSNAKCNAWFVQNLFDWPVKRTRPGPTSTRRVKGAYLYGTIMRHKKLNNTLRT